VEVFNGQELDDLLGKITEEAKSIIPDLTTKKGRDEIASMAHKVAKSKTYLDGLRKDLVSDWKNKAKAVDAEGKKMRDTLDALKAEVRQPSTEWEDAENKRVETHERNIKEITSTAEDAANNWMDEELQSMFNYVESFKVEDFEEFSPVAASAKDRAIASIKESIVKRETYDKEQAELEKLRKDAEERERKERESKIAEEAAAKAKKEAEDAANNREQEMENLRILAEERAEKEQQAIQEESDRKVKEAEERGRKAVEEEKAKVKAEADKKEKELLADEAKKSKQAHRQKIHSAAKKSFIERGFGEEVALQIVELIRDGEIKNVSIDY